MSIEFWTYNNLDAMSCLECFHPIMDELVALNNLEAYDANVSLVEPFCAMQYRGIRLNSDGLIKAADEAKELVASLKDKLKSLVGYDINPGSHKQLKDYFYIKKGYKPYTSRATGAISVDEDALIRLARKGALEAQVILDIREQTTRITRYLEVKLDPDGRLRGAFDPAGTSTGRVSVKKTLLGTGLNLQTIPHVLYDYILADEGYIFYSGDCSQAENRVVAYIAPEPAMIMAFENKVDIHRQTASLIYSKPVEEIADEERQWGKKANHGLNYGLGYKSFAIINRIQEQFSKWVVERYHSSYPGVRNSFHAGVKRQLGNDRVLRNLFGRARKFYDRWGEELFKDAYSYIPQSTVAEMINRWGILFLYYSREHRRVELLNNMHDGIWFQIPINIGLHEHERILKALRASMEQPLKCNAYEFRIPFEIKAGLSLGQSKTLNWEEPIVQQLTNIVSGLTDWPTIKEFKELIGFEEGDTQ